MNTTAPGQLVDDELFATVRFNEVFDDLTLPNAQKLVKSRDDPQAKVNRLFYNGDHWQKGAGWVGPRAGGTATPALNNLTLTAIEQVFVSQNVIAETTGRHVNGLLSRELHWKFVPKRSLGTVEEVDPDTQQKTVKPEEPNAAEQALIQEAQDALVTWWDKRGGIEILQTLWASVLNTKRDVLRFFVPAGLVSETGELPVKPLDEALDYIWLQHLGSNEDTLDLQFPNATVYTHKATRQQIGIFTYEEARDLALSGPEESSGEQRAELTYLADDGNTVLRVIGQTGTVGEPVLLPLGGRLTMYEVARRPLITPQVVSQQKLLNMTATMMSKNVEVGGFLERTFFNVQWPGKWVGEGENKRFVADPIMVGPGYLTSLQGVVIEGDDEKPIIATPSVEYREPVDTKTFIETKDATYLAILQETHQLHYARSGDNTQSGESRRQARDAYQRDLKYSATKLAGAVRWILETALAMAAHFSGQPGRFEELRAHVTVRISSGPVAPDDMRVALEMHQGGAWDWETMVSETGQDDVDAIKQRLQQEQVENAKREAETMARMEKLAAEINPARVEGGEGSPQA